jgi:23S rRNA pseudouridine2457 synthase
VLIALHKPYDVLSQFTQEAEGQRTLAEFDLPKSVYPIGRLDRDSEGLLLLSNEKQLVDRLLNPRGKVKKTYWVQVEGTPSNEQLTDLAKGVRIRINKKEHLTAPASVDRLPLVKANSIAPRNPPVRFRKTVPDAWLQLEITEGKNRQVRRMCAAVGLPVLRLIRTTIGPYRLDGIQAGSWVKLT